MGEINFAKIIIALLPARSLLPTHPRDGPFVELLIAQLLTNNSTRIANCFMLSYSAQLYTGDAWR